MALGATLVALIVTIKETTHVFVNWRSNRLVRRKEKVDALHRDGTHAFMSKRTARRSEPSNAPSSSIPIGRTRSCGSVTFIGRRVT